MKIRNVASNMTEVHLNNGDVVLVSYETPVALYRNGVIYRTSYQHSKTTSRHISKWFGTRTVFDSALVQPQEFFDGLI